ncbi:MAG: TDP-fucosamine acetyltransferase [candidate division BRC1 bacterium ADurb.BinA364]|nr:MAG: TDP-fucosamine acetyltransferase [candidate division BRC1 bacterium ADurb.BinA364]
MCSAAVHNASLSDLSDFADLIRRYPFKRFQQAIQGIDKDRLNAYLIGALEASLREEGAMAWLARIGGRCAAGAVVSPNPWHSGFYDMNMARCSTFLNYARPAEAGPALIGAILDGARARGCRHLSVRIDGDDYPSLRQLEAAGFRLIDCSLKLAARIAAEPPAESPGMAVRAFRPEDREAVLRIAESCHPRNHFYNDPQLDRERTDRLFRAWVDRCLEGLAKRVFVAENADGVQGFVAYLANRALNEALGLSLAVLDYIALDTHAQGRGLGYELMSRSLRALAGEFDQVELRTSQNNYPALACYAKYGFRIAASDFILHRSIEE